MGFYAQEIEVISREPDSVVSYECMYRGKIGEKINFRKALFCCPKAKGRLYHL